MSDRLQIQARVASFEQCWLADASPNIEHYLFENSPENKQINCELLIELICIDLEFRWSNKFNRGIMPRDWWKLDVYIARFSELLSATDLPLELIGEEYRVRQRWGDKPTHDSFLSRFVNRREELAALLTNIDREMRLETDNIPIKLHKKVAKDSAFDDERDPRAPLDYSDFVLQELIGAGRTGKVYRALQRSTNRQVAIKYLRKQFMQQPAAVERFITEAETVARFKHPNIVSLIGLGKTPVSYFMAMELIDGPDLAQVVRQQTVNIEDAVRWTIAACEAIEHAHEQGVIHCDLKPGNLLLDGSGQLYVTDFGFAQTFPAATSQTERLEGTAPFMAPEQISCYWGPISPRTDVYGLGAVLFTLLSGRTPWRDASIPDILAEVVSSRPAWSIKQFRADLPKVVVEVCDTCLAKRPFDRFETVRELRKALIGTMECGAGAL